MADFDIAVAITLKNEDGPGQKLFYQSAEHALKYGDPGGETVHGIARNPWPNWPGWLLVDASKTSPNFPLIMLSNQELMPQVLAFYQSNFWNKVRGGLINSQQIANQVFDEAVNAGSRAASKLLQESVNWVDNCLAVDGNIGPVTIQALNRICFSAGGSDKILGRFLDLRRARYQALAADLKAKGSPEANDLPVWLARCSVA